MTRAMMTTKLISAPANHFGTLPAAKYVPRAGTVADLEAQLRHEQAIHATRAQFAAKREQRARLTIKLLSVALMVATVATAAALAL